LILFILLSYFKDLQNFLITWPSYLYDSSSPATSQELATETVHGNAGFPQLSGNTSTDLTHVSAAHVNGVIDALASDDGFMDLWTAQLQHASNEVSGMQPVGGQFPDYSNDWAAAFDTMGPHRLQDGSDAWTHTSIQDIDMNYSASTPFPLPKLISLYNVQLSNSITLTPKDHNALIYYQSDIGPCQTTKSPRWSFSALLLRLALRSSMVMHLLLAVSIYDLSTAQNTPANLQAASAHFKEGTRMFIEIKTYGSAEDYPVIISAFYFIYLYLTRQVAMDRSKIGEPSRTAANYIEKCSLGGLKHFSSQTKHSSVPSDILEGGGILPQTVAQRCDSSLAARLIIWQYSEDSFISFHGCGGGLSTRLCNDPNQLDRLRQISADALSLNWGDEYPADEVLVDINHFHPIDMLIDMISLHQEIIKQNNAYMETGLTETLHKLDSRFSILEIVCILLSIQILKC
jgi:hypothetical protein